MTEQYTCLDGRAIARDGVRFVYLQPCKTDTGSANFAYWEADQFARLIPLLIEILRDVDASEQFATTRAKMDKALKMLEFKL